MWCPSGIYFRSLLFISCIVATSSLFDIVDDTTFLFSHPDIVSNLTFVNKELSKINNWLKANKLSVNANKTNYTILMILGASFSTNRYVNAPHVSPGDVTDIASEYMKKESTKKNLPFMDCTS